MQDFYNETKEARQGLIFLNFFLGDGCKSASLTTVSRREKPPEQYSKQIFRSGGQINEDRKISK